MNFASCATASKRYIPFFLAIILTLGCATTKDPGNKKTRDEIDITWPQPPQKPRVRFVEMIRSNRDVEGRTRRNLKEILLGIDPDRLAVTLGRPMDVTTDSRGRILVTDSSHKGIHVYDPVNHSFDLYGTEGKGALSWPIGIDVDAGDNIYVADTKAHRLVKYDPEGNYIWAIGDFANPVGVAVDQKRGRVFVADSKEHVIKVLNTEGEKTSTVGERGTDEGQFNFPTFIDVDNDGALYVVDFGNFRVQVFSSSLEVEGGFGSVGVYPGQFSKPKGISVDSRGIIYVVDNSHSNFQMFDKEFQLLLPVGSFGREAGQFTMPTGVHVSDNDLICITDFGNSRLQILEYISDGSETELSPEKK